MPQSPVLQKAVVDLPWSEIYRHLGEQGYALTPRIMSGEQCAQIIGYFDQSDKFRSTIDMEKRNFGKGVYKYFSYPLPKMIEELRELAYEQLVTIANEWGHALKTSFQYPALHKDFLALCHKHGQTRPTPLILKYLVGDYNCLHQDLYGELSFPFQMAILLSEPGREFEGGEFVLVEQRPRVQSKVEIVPLTQGQAVIFAVNHRPAKGTRGTYRVTMRHGVSKLRSGSRFTLGIIFHDAK
jgi:hypothetical protein